MVMNMRKNKYFTIGLITSFAIFFLIIFTFANEQNGEQTTVENMQNNLCTEVPRNVLIELFINEDCTVCPKAAFCLEDLAWSYEPGTVILVEAHIWGDGHDIPQTNARYDWYTGSGTKGTPDAFFNGLAERVYGLHSNCADIDENIAAYRNIIEKQLAESTPIEIEAAMETRGGKIIIGGSVINRSHSQLQNLMLGGMVYYEGDESEFFYLVKDIFGEQDICQLAPLEEKNFDFVSHLDLAELEDDELDRYYGVVFVQDKITKEVLQAFLAH